MNISQDARNAIARSAQLHERERTALPRQVRVARERQLIEDWLRLAAIEAGLNPFPSTSVVIAGAGGVGPGEHATEVSPPWNS